MDGAKKLADLARSYDKVDLYRQAVDLMAEVNALANQNAALESENRRLRDVSGLRGSLIFRMNTYWRPTAEGDVGDGPFCSRCFDEKDRLVRLHTREAQYGWTAQCPLCKESVSPQWHPDYGR
jgi:hypothetical protein